MSTQAKKTPAEFAANYPVAPSDGRYANVAVGNITIFNGRYLVNLAIKTQNSIKSFEAGRTKSPGAVLSYPESWGPKYQTGQHLDLEVVDGWASKLLTPKYAKAVAANAPAVSAAAVITASNTVIETMPAAPVAEKVEAPAAVVMAGEKEEAPF